LKISLQIVFDGRRLSAQMIPLLREIDALGSIVAAAKKIGISYKAAWRLADELNKIFDTPLVKTRTGGGVGSARLTEWGRQVVVLYSEINDETTLIAVARLEHFLNSITLGKSSTPQLPLPDDKVVRNCDANDASLSPQALT
jgi:molybdate transport system regulatory protein